MSKEINSVIGSPALVLSEIPTELADKKQWVVAKISYNVVKSKDEGKAKYDKRPVMLDGKTAASSTNSTTWHTLKQVCDACDLLQRTAKDRAYNRYLPGLVMVEEGGYYGLDFDDCVQNEAVSKSINECLEPFIKSSGCYIELSCSGRGLRVIGKGSKKSSKCKYVLDGSIGIEVYDKGRFLVITGYTVNPTSQLIDTQNELDEFQSSLDGVSVDELNIAKLTGNDKPDRSLTAPTLLELAQIKTALIVLSSDDYLEDRTNWLFTVVCPIKRRFSYSDEGVELGLSILDEYSSGLLAGVSQPTKYHGYDDVKNQWDSVSNNYQGKPKTLGSLFYSASQKGWISPKYGQLKFKSDGVYLEYTHPSTGLTHNINISKAYNWEDKLRTYKDNSGSVIIEPCINNITLILNYHPTWIGTFALNELSGTVVKLRSPIHGIDPGVLKDSDLTRVKMWMNNEYPELDPGEDSLDKIIQVIAENNAFSPVKDYLSTIPKWDQTPRVDDLFIKYGGADDSEFTRFVTRKYLIGAVARAIVPGCKMDYSLCLLGEQGLLKSAVLETLAVNPEWFCDEAGSIDDKDINFKIGGKWIIEFGEMVSLKKADIETMKFFLTKRVDEWRPPYRRYTIRKPRPCVFAFTGNMVQFLADPTGNRRYWPVIVTQPFDLAAIKSEIDMIWAEALHYYINGEVWHPSNRYEDDLCKNAQENHYACDSVEEQLKNFLITHGCETITSQEISNRFNISYQRVSNLMIRRFKCTENKNCSLTGGRGSMRGYNINRVFLEKSDVTFERNREEVKMTCKDMCEQLEAMGK